MGKYLLSRKPSRKPSRNFSGKPSKGTGKGILIRKSRKKCRELRPWSSRAALHFTLICTTLTTRCFMMSISERIPHSPRDHLTNINTQGEILKFLPTAHLLSPLILLRPDQPPLLHIQSDQDGQQDIQGISIQLKSPPCRRKTLWPLGWTSDVPNPPMGRHWPTNYP